MMACTRAGVFFCFVEPIDFGLFWPMLRAACDADASAKRAAQIESDPVLRALVHVREVVLSLRTIEEAETVAAFVAEMCPQPARQALGVSELLLNAIEHGNLEIGSSEKAALVEGDRFLAEVARRLRDPAYQGREVTVWLRRFSDHVEFVCEDDGAGFDWRSYLREQSELSLTDSRAVHGRGIALSQSLAFDSLEYAGRGNVAVARAYAERGTRAPASIGTADISSWEKHTLELEADRVFAQAIEGGYFDEVLALCLRTCESTGGFISYLNESGDLVVPAMRLHDSIAEAPSGEPAVVIGAAAARESFAEVLVARRTWVRNAPYFVPLANASVQRSVATPILHRGRPIGILEVANRVAPYTWREARRLEVLAQRLAPSLAAHIDNAIATRRCIELEWERLRQLEEQELARHLVSRMIREGCLDAPGIRSSFSSKDLFNGDFALAANLPDGSLRWMLGDFVGHGLPAAIGGLPLASVFYATAKKGISLEEVARTMSDSLLSSLPRGFFCAAVLLEVSLDGKLRCWNGGMPAPLIRSANSERVREVPSVSVPLGVLPGAEIDTSVATLDVLPGDRVLCMSDGLTEARSPDGALFGSERAMAAISACPADGIFDSLLSALASFRGDAPAPDDLSLVEVTIHAPPRASALNPLNP